MVAAAFGPRLPGGSPTSSSFGSGCSSNTYRVLSLEKESSAALFLQQFRRFACCSCTTSFAAASSAPPTSPTPPVVGFAYGCSCIWTSTPWWFADFELFWQWLQLQHLQGAEFRKRKQCSFVLAAISTFCIYIYI